LVNVTAEDLLGMNAKIASPEMFREANVELSPALEGVKLAIERRDNGQPYIRVSSSQPISSASLNLLVEVNWASGRLVRDYPVLLNPPKSTANATGAGAVSTPGFVNQAPPAEPKEKEAAAPAVEPTKPVAPVATPAPPAPTASPAPPSAPAATASAAAESQRDEPSPPPALPAGATSPERGSEKISKTADASAKPRKVVKVKNGDTLTTIAAKLHPSKGMLEQTMIAVFEANRQAFIKDNVNRIRAGSNLQLPDAAEVSAVPAEEASKRLKLMAKDFDAYRGRLASAAAARPVASTSAKSPVTGKMEGAADDAAAPVKSGANDVLKLSRSAEGKKSEKTSGNPEAKTDKVKPNSAAEDKLKEEAIVRDNQLKEARERSAMLEKDVAQMRKLLQEKDAQARQIEIENAKKAEEQKKAAAKIIAAPVTLPESIKPGITEEQKEAARKESQAAKEALAAKESQSKKDSDVKKEVETKPAEEVKAKGAEAGEASKGQEPPAEANKATGEANEKDAKENEQDKKEAVKEEEKPLPPLGRPEKKAEALEPPAESSSALSLLLEHPFAIGGGLLSGLLIGWLGLVALKRRRERLQDALFEPDPIDPISHGVPTLEPEASPEAEQPKSAQIAETIKSFAETDAVGDPGTEARQDVDPIEEADVYIAYGRNEQAEEILLKAIVADPARLELLKKLLDLYAMEKRLPDFAQGFTKLQSLAPAGSTLLAAARRMGAEIDPANSLYSMVAPTAAPAAAAPVISPAPAAPAAPGPDLSAINLDVTSGPAPTGGPQIATAPSTPASSIVPPVPGESATPPTSFADIDLDVEKPAAVPAAVTPPAERGPEWQAVATQLDLARAYLEIEDKDNARDLLNEVIAKGDAGQRSEAERILAELGA